MSYDIRKVKSGEALVMPLELPMYDGNNSELGRQAQVCLTSFLRHAAVCDWMLDNLDTRDEAIQESYSQEWSQAASQLASLFTTLSGLAENLQIDIMQEIWDMPWEV